MAEGLKKGFLQASKIKEQKPETSNSSSTTSSLIKQFSQSQQPPTVEKQRQSQIKQELKQTETEQNEQQNIYFLPKPKPSNYMKSDISKSMIKQKNEDQFLIETLLKPVRILKEVVKILRQINQKLLEKSQNTEERLVIQEIEVKQLLQKRIEPSIQEIKMEIEDDRQIEPTNIRRIIKRCYLCQSRFHNYKLCKIYKEQMKRNSEEVLRELARIYVTMDGRIYRKRIFQSSSRTPKKHPNFYFKPPGVITGWQRKLG